MAKGLMKELDYKAREFYEFVMPAVDMYEDRTDLVVIIDLPGFSKKEISLMITGNILSISAKRDEPEKLGTTYYQHRPGKLSKKVVLPLSFKEDETAVGNATYENGVVRLRIPIPQSASIPIT